MLRLRLAGLPATLCVVLAAAFLAAGAARAEPGNSLRERVQPSHVKQTASHGGQGRAAPRRHARAAKIATPAPRVAAAAARHPGIDRAPVAALPARVPASNPYGWLVTVNAKTFVSPRFTGARNYGFIGYPTLSFRRPGEPPQWSSPDDSIQFRAVSTPTFAIGPVVAYRGGRYDRDAGALRGVHNPRWTIEGGVFAEAWAMPGAVRLRAELRRGFRGEDGFVASLGADYVASLDRLTIAFGPRVKLGDGRFMRNQFGVTAADNAANPRLPVYRPTGGLTSVGAYGSLSYALSDQWSATLHGGYDRLVRDAARSPIVARSGSRDQYSIGAIASYTFEWK